VCFGVCNYRYSGDSLGYGVEELAKLVTIQREWHGDLEEKEGDEDEEFKG